MSKIFGLFLISTLFLFFQNCGGPNLGLDYRSQNASMLQSFVTPTQPVLAIDIPLNKKVLSIDLETGITSLKLTPSNIEQLDCLNQDDFEMLRFLTENLKICESKLVSESTECTQQYSPPYARLVFDDSMLSLGESFDGCGRGVRDICGEQANAFKDQITTIVNKCK